MKSLFEKTLPARLKSIALLSQPVLRCAREQGMKEDKLKKLYLALGEIVKITDSGRPFNVAEEAPPPDIKADLDKRRAGGLGVLLVKKTMDIVTYHRVKNKNILTVGVLLRPAGDITRK